MKSRHGEKDVVDVLITSISNKVDTFSQYPLLDGDKKYTVEITEFVCPLAGQGPLPSQTFTFLEVRRKRLNADNVLPANDNTSLTMLAAPLGDPLRHFAGHAYLPGNFTDEVVQFQNNTQRPMQSPGDVAYQLQRFFDDIRAKYIPTDPAAMETARENYQEQQDIVDNPNSTQAEIAVALGLINGPAGNNGLLSIYLVHGPFRAIDHGGGDDVQITTNTPFVSVTLGPNSVLQLTISPFFGKHFFVLFSGYGALLTGLALNDHFLAVNEVDGVLQSGLLALTGDENPGNTIIVGGSVQSIQFRGEYPLERHFDHRIRLEVESQMNTPPTVAWTTSGLQKMSHIISTFPISTTTQSSVLLNSEGVSTGDVRYQTDVLLGDIIWRRAEQKISERYLINNSKHFYNIRLEVFIVRKEWKELLQEFSFAKEKLIFENGQTWTAKLRFRSI